MKRGKLFSTIRRSKALPVFLFLTMLAFGAGVDLAQAAVTGPGAPLAVSDGQTVPPFPMIDNGQVNVVVSDTIGGWYVGGTFTSVGGDVSYKRLIHITSAGSLDTGFQPTPNNAVHSLLLNGTNLYVGGDFSIIGENGLNKTRLALVNANQTDTVNYGNAISTFTATADVSVRALAVNGSTLYVGGDFRFINSTARNALAAVSATTGALQTFNPNVRQSSGGGFVNTLLFESPTLYVGGLFTTIGTNNLARNNAAAVDTAGVANSYNPNVGGTNARVFNIQKLVASGSVYLCGNFTSVRGDSHNGIAETTLTPDSGAPTSWDPQLSFGVTVNTCLIRGNSIYAGGNFTAVNNGSVVRNRIAELDRTVLSGPATPWNPDASNTVTAFALNDAQTVVYAGGTFTSIGASQADGTDPISSVITDPVSPNGDNAWFTSDVGYTVTADDLNGSGVANIYVCADQTNTCDPQINNTGVNGIIVTEGVNYISHRAIDNAGNLEDIKLDIINLDKTDPISSLGGLPAFDGDGLINLSWSSSDVVSGVQEVKLFRGTTLIYTTTSAAGNFVDDLSAPINNGQTLSYTAQVKDMAGRITVSTTQTTTIDFTAPVSTLTTTPAIPNGANGWFTSDVGYAVTATDSGSGVANIYVCVDQTNTCDPQAVNSGATGTISTEGMSYIRFQSKDSVNNTESVQIALIKLDKNNPTISLQSLLQYDGDGLVNASWSASDIVSGVQEIRIYRNNTLIHTATNANGNFVDDLSAPANDGQTFIYRAEVTDVSGRNGIATDQSTTVDLSAASIPDMIPLPVFTNTTSVTAQWHRSVDTVSGVDFYNFFKDLFTSPLTTVDEVDPQGTDTSAQRSYTDLAVAHGETHTYKASSVDLATPAHESQQSNGATTTIDTSTPVTTATLSPASPDGQNAWYVSTISISLACADTVSGCAQTYKSVNGAPLSLYTGSFVISADGQYTVSYYSVDNAGNSEVISNLNLKLDATAPTIADDPTPTTTTNASITLTGIVTETTSGIQSFTINGTSVSLAGDGSYSHTITLNQDLNTITYVATDNAGNQTTVVRTITLVTNDIDGDGVIDSQDACPTIPGTVQRQGCPVGLNEIVTFHKKGVRGGALANAVLRVFDRDDSAFISAYGTQKPSSSQFPNIFEAGIGQVGTCTTDSQGMCTVGLTTAAHNYLTVVKFVDGSSVVFYDGDFTNAGNFSDTDNDAQPDSATSRIKMNLN